MAPHQPHLFVDISSHGYGHLAQTAPVLNRLAELRPDIRVTLRSGLPQDKLKQRISLPFEHLPAASDFGYAMIDAMAIDHADTFCRYLDAHADFRGRVEAEAVMLREHRVDAVFANVSYLPLAGADLAGIPAIALCSLNWADLYAHYFGTDPLHADMCSAYRGASFLRTTPGMQMHAPDQVIDIPPIATRGTDRRIELCAKVCADKTARFVLIALGGIPSRLPVEHWPELPDTHWLVPQAWEVSRRDMHAFEALGLPFVDLLRSVDAVVTKPGYGTFTEATCNGTAVLYQQRDDGWPEQDCLIDWLQAHARCVEISANDLLAGNLGPALDSCLRSAVPPAPTFTGDIAAAQFLARMLPRSLA